MKAKKLMALVLALVMVLGLTVVPAREFHPLQGPLHSPVRQYRSDC